jgi:hypothetical protein
LARSEVKVRQWRQKPLVAACGPLLAGGVRHTEVKPDYCQTHAEQAANGRISPLFGPHTHTFPATTNSTTTALSPVPVSTSNKSHSKLRDAGSTDIAGTKTLPHLSQPGRWSRWRYLRAEPDSGPDSTQTSLLERVIAEREITADLAAARIDNSTQIEPDIFLPYLQKDTCTTNNSH